MLSETIRDAALYDLPALISLLQDDELGRTREHSHDDSAYQRAMELIIEDSSQTVADN